MRLRAFALAGTVLGIGLLASSSVLAFDLCNRLDVRYLNAHTGQHWTREPSVTMLPAGETVRCQWKAGANTVQVHILKEIAPAAPQKSQFGGAPRIAGWNAGWYTRTPDLDNINAFSYGAVRFAGGYVYVVEGLPEGRGVSNAWRLAAFYIKAISPR